MVQRRCVSHIAAVSDFHHCIVACQVISLVLREKGTMTEEPVTLAEFYSSPSIDHLRGLSSADFDAVLIQVFELAGYDVSKGNASLILSRDSKPVALCFISYNTQIRV